MICFNSLPRAARQLAQVPAVRHQFLEMGRRRQRPVLLPEGRQEGRKEGRKGHRRGCGPAEALAVATVDQARAARPAHALGVSGAGASGARAAALRTVAFISRRGGNPELYSMATSGRDVRRSRATPRSIATRCTARDGRSVAFVSERDGDPEVMRWARMAWACAGSAGIPAPTWIPCGRPAGSTSRSCRSARPWTGEPRALQRPVQPGGTPGAGGALAPAATTGSALLRIRDDRLGRRSRIRDDRPGRRSRIERSWRGPRPRNGGRSWSRGCGG